MLKIEKHIIVLYDGVCNLCNSSVQFIIKRDKKDLFRFAASQTEAGEQLCSVYNVKPIKNDTLIVIEHGKVYTKSTAALKIARRLSGLWPTLTVFFIVPRFIRDYIYGVIAKNRYKWFGRQDTCVKPSTEEKEKFIENIKL
ncbi:MAG: thiol-disulfide oxidoreductase DCC family protein [Bacteroidales bacterium]